MPSVSDKQHNAMEAAAHGHSTLGIPKSVGQEFVDADKTAHDEAPVRAAGVMHRDPDGNVLFAKRSDTGEWAFPGGCIEEGESPEDAARRESHEETGVRPEQLHEVHHHEHNGVDFTTFAHNVEKPFVPELDYEHHAHAWAKPEHAPEPLHPGVRKALDDIQTERDARFTVSEGMFEIVQPDDPQPAPGYMDDLEEGENPDDAVVKLDITA